MRSRERIDEHVRPQPAPVPSAQPVVRRSSLVVGAADDPAEREADEIANRVVRYLASGGSRPEPAGPAGGASPIGRIRRSGAVIRRDIPADAAVQVWDESANKEVDPPPAVPVLNSAVGGRRGTSTDGTWKKGDAFNNGSKDGPGRVVSFDRDVTLPKTVAAGGDTYTFTGHFVANLMYPRDDAHGVPVREVVSAIEGRNKKVADKPDPRWSGDTFQGKNLKLVLGGKQVVTAFYKDWDAGQEAAYEAWRTDAEGKRKAQSQAGKQAAADRDRGEAENLAKVKKVIKDFSLSPVKGDGELKIIANQIGAMSDDAIADLLKKRLSMVEKKAKAPKGGTASTPQSGGKASGGKKPKK